MTKRLHQVFPFDALANGFAGDFQTQPVVNLLLFIILVSRLQ